MAECRLAIDLPGVLPVDPGSLIIQYEENRSDRVSLGISVLALLSDSAIAESGPSGPGPLRGEARGIYFLTPAEGNRHTDLASLDCWDNPNIVGVALRATWAVIEPSPDQFDWSFFDEALGIAKLKKNLSPSASSREFGARIGSFVPRQHCD